MLDYFDDNNSLLIDGKVGFAPAQAIYWQQKNGTTWFNPSIDDAVSKLRYAYENIDMLKLKFNRQEEIKQKYSWNNITSQILDLAK